MTLSSLPMTPPSWGHSLFALWLLLSYFSDLTCKWGQVVLVLLHGHPGWFYFEAVIKNVIRWAYSYPLSHTSFISFGDTHNSWMAGSYVYSTFNILSNPSTMFPDGNTNWHPYQLCVSPSFSPQPCQCSSTIFSVAVSLTGEPCPCTVLLLASPID